MATGILSTGAVQRCLEEAADGKHPVKQEQPNNVSNKSPIHIKDEQ